MAVITELPTQKTAKQRIAELRDRIFLKPIAPTNDVAETVEPGRRGVMREVAYNVPVGKRRAHSFMLELPQGEELPQVYRSRFRPSHFVVDADINVKTQTVEKGGVTYQIERPAGPRIDTVRLGVSGNYILFPRGRKYATTHVRVRGDQVISHVLATEKGSVTVDRQPLKSYTKSKRVYSRFAGRYVDRKSGGRVIVRHR